MSEAANNLTIQRATISISEQQVAKLPKPVRNYIRTLAAENAELQKRVLVLQDLTTQDALTGAPNKIAFDKRAAEIFARMRRYKEGLARGRKGSEPVFTFVTIDLDGFKTVNDTHGHEAGDQAILHTVQFFQRHLREGYDFFARRSGDEFLVIMDCTDEQAKAALARLRQKFDQAPCAYKGKKLGLSFSYGTRQLRDDDDTLSDVLRESDIDMYKDKTTRKGWPHPHQSGSR